MFFRNLHLFRFSPAVAETLSDIADSLDGKRLRTCGALESATRGFVSPHGRDGVVLAHTIAPFTLVALGSEHKLLPSAVVNDELAKRVRKVAETEGRRIGGKERRRLKDEVLEDLLPRAFVRSSRLFAYLDLRDGWLVVDSASRGAAEQLLSELREAVGSLPVAPMAPEESPRALLTAWVNSGQLPDGFALGDAVELRDPADSGAVVRCRGQDLETDEVREHLKCGKTVAAVALTFDDRLSFVLTEDMVVRKLKFLDLVLDQLGDVVTDTAAAEFDARFALMSLEVARLLSRLDEIFGLPRPAER